jgi:hypothetical protein
MMLLKSPFSKKTNVYISAKENADASFDNTPTVSKKLHQLPTVENFLAIMDDNDSSDSSYYSAKSTASSSSTINTFLLDDEPTINTSIAAKFISPKSADVTHTFEPPPIPPRRSSMPFLKTSSAVTDVPPLPANAKKITDAYSKKLKLDER